MRRALATTDTEESAIAAAAPTVRGPLTVLLDQDTEVYSNRDPGTQTPRATAKGRAAEARVGQAVMVSGWPDPERAGVAHAARVYLQGLSSFTRGTKRASRDPKPAVVEHGGRLYVSDLWSLRSDLVEVRSRVAGVDQS